MLANNNKKKKPLFEFKYREYISIEKNKRM